MREHSLITTLRTLRGNPRGCVYTEPIWGIAYNLYAPYTSLYMVALGLADQQIGLIVSVSWAFQIGTALLSGAITDKVGRRRTTLIVDLLSWTVPALISAVAQNFWFFLVAGIINSLWRIADIAWTCLLVEDADHSQLVDIFTWISIANIVAGFVAPLTGLLISAFTLVPTVRGLYLFAAVVITLKAILTYRMTEETQQGLVRLEQTRNESVFHVLAGYRAVLRDVLRAPRTLYTAGIMLVMSIYSLISGSFWAILVTEKLRVPAEFIAIAPFIRSAIMLLFFFVVMPRLSKMHFAAPLVAGFVGLVISQAILVVTPALGYPLLLTSLFLESCSLAAVRPLINQLTVLTVDARERARIQSLLHVGIILVSSPFGWIAGSLSDIDKAWPFILNLALLVGGALLAYIAGTRRLAAAAPASANG